MPRRKKETTKKAVKKNTRGRKQAEMETKEARTSTPSMKMEETSSSNRFQNTLNSTNSRKYFIAIIVVLLLIALAFYKKEWFVAAVVNGKPITRAELNDRLTQQYGDSELTQLINETLIEQQIAQNHITISDSDVNNKIEDIKKNSLPAGMSLDQALAAQHMTMDELKKNIRLQLALEKILEPQTQVSDAEVQKYIEDNKAQLPATDSASLANLAKESLKQQKQQQALSTWMDDVNKKASIMKFL